MLKLNASFSKKVPIEGQQFSSQSFHASVEIELSDALKPEEIKTRIHDTFNLVRQSVEQELNGKTRTETAPQTPAAQNGNSERKATNKQIKFITDLAGQKGIAISQLNADIKKQFGGGLYDLTSKQASTMVDDLKRRKAA
jgi:hypothetical protein